MASIKEQLESIEAATQDGARVSKPKITALLMTLTADLQEDDTEVTAEDLAALTGDNRKIALMGFCALIAAGLNE